MTNLETIGERKQEDQWTGNERNSRLWTGIFFIIVGGAALAKSFMVPMPEWLFTWQTLLITIGIFIGIRDSFQGAAWLILIMIGTAFLLNDFYFSGDLRRHVWPVVIIAIGAVFVFKPRKGIWRRKFRQNLQMDAYIDSTGREEDFSDITIVFGSVRKNVVSKKFAGGDITSIFAGAELDLTDADLHGQAVIDVTTIFGGVELIIPSNWTIKSEVVSVFGSVKDKRIQSATPAQDTEKVIILDGTALFGGIEIKSFKK